MSAGSRGVCDGRRIVLKRISGASLREKSQVRRKTPRAAAREEYKFSLMQSDEGAQLKKENGLSIAYDKSLNFAREVWNVKTLVQTCDTPQLGKRITYICFFKIIYKIK